MIPSTGSLRPQGKYMDWAIAFSETVTSDNLLLVKETLAAKHQTELGHYDTAARILWELIIEAKHREDAAWECITMVHMGKVYRVLRWGIAVKLYNQAIKLADAIDFKRAKMMALNDLGEMRCSWGELEVSIALFKQSLSLAPLGDIRARRDILLNLAVANEGLGRLAVCRSLLVELIELDKELEHQDLFEDQEYLAEIEARLMEDGNEREP